MTLRNILEKAASLVGVGVDFTQTGEEQTRFINAGKDVLMRVTGEFFDVKRTENLTATGKLIPYSAFSRSVKRIWRVRQDGVRARFSERADGIMVEEDGSYEVTYAYFTDSPDFLHDVDLPPRFNVYVLALGTASEYCYGKGYYEEGKHYDERFVQSINNVARAERSVVLKAVDYEC